MSIHKTGPRAQVMGRKKLPPGKKKASNFLIRLAPADKKKLRADAKKAGFKKMSAYVRHRLGLS